MASKTEGVEESTWGKDRGVTINNTSYLLVKKNNQTTSTAKHRDTEKRAYISYLEKMLRFVF